MGDERRHEFCGIDVASAHLKEMRVTLGEKHVGELFDIVDLRHGEQRVSAKVRAHDDGLRLIVRDAAYADVALHMRDISVKLGTEIRGFDVVDSAVETFLVIVDDKPGPPGSQM